MNEAPTPLVIFEPNFRGHRLLYVRALLRSNPAALFASSDETFDSEEYRQHIVQAGVRPNELRLGKLPDIGDPQYFSWTHDGLNRIASELPTSHVVILEGDKQLIRPLRVPKRGRLTTLVMRTPSLSWDFKASVLSALKLALMHWARLRGIRVVALLPATYTQRMYSWRGFAATPDPVDMYCSAEDIERLRLGLPLREGITWFGLFGNISERKNLPLVAKVLAQLARNHQIGLLVMGKVDPQELQRAQLDLERITHSGGQVILVNRLVSDGDLDAAISAVDASVLAHTSDGPSGILGKSVAAGTSVLAAGAPVLRHEVARLEAGYWSELSDAAMSGMISAFLTQPRTRMRRSLAKSPDFARSLIGAPVD